MELATGIKMLKRSFRLLSLLLMALLSASCVYEFPSDLDGSDDAFIDSNKVVLQLNIQPLSSSSSASPTEKIKSVRVIVIKRGEGSAPDSIEHNRLIQVPYMPAKDYSYILRLNSSQGLKDIYVIANESSVAPGLSNALDGYAENQPSGDFVDWIDDYAFAPVYTPDDNNDLYLPYSFSRTGLEPKAGTLNTVNAWLIPVATKFVFNFTNNRSYDVNVKGISMAYANQSNYLLGHPGSGEITKQYNGKDLYWADWLAEISKNSWNYPDFSGNEGYNGEVGWISDYFLPSPDDYGVFTFIAEGSDDWFPVDAATTQEEDGVETIIPGKHSTPVYYLPESSNFIRLGSDLTDSTPGEGDGDSEAPEQRFYLTILLEDTGPSNAPLFKDVAIPNLKALFRNTYVIIDLTMSEGDIEVYAEIAPWTPKTANGWVNEGNAPSNNPFKIKKKW